MRNLKQYGFYAFHVAVLFYGSLLFWAGAGGLLDGQSFQRRVTQSASREVEQVTDLERRVDALEGLNMDHRLTVIETVLRDVDGNSKWNQMSMGGVGLLLARAVYESIRRRQQGGNPE